MYRSLENSTIADLSVAWEQRNATGGTVEAPIPGFGSSGFAGPLSVSLTTTM